MQQRHFFAFLLFFLVPAVLYSQSGPVDSTGTIYVKKKRDSTSIMPVKEEVFIIVEEMPSFPEEEKSLEQFIEAAFVVPQEAIEKGISGSVIVSVLVDADGSLKDARVAKGVSNCKTCNAEALRVVNIMPAWKPGRQNGRNVPVRISIIVKFRFKK